MDWRRGEGNAAQEALDGANRVHKEAAEDQRRFIDGTGYRPGDPGTGGGDVPIGVALLPFIL